MATILYARVSTSEQPIRDQYQQAQAGRYWITDVMTDTAVKSATAKLADRAGGGRLYKRARSGDTVVVRWLDRLGRNYAEVADNVQEFMRRGVVVKTIINGLTFDSATKDPSAQAVRDALIGFMVAMAQAQAEATNEAQKAGIARAKAGKDKAYRGRKPSFTESQISEIISLTGEGKGVTLVAKQVGLSRAAIYRILKCPADAYASVRAWSCPIE